MRTQQIGTLLLFDELLDAPSASLRQDNLLQPLPGRDFSDEVAPAAGWIRGRSYHLRATAIRLNDFAQSFGQYLVLLGVLLSNDCLCGTADTALVASSTGFHQGNEKVTPSHRTLPKHFFSVSQSLPQAANCCATPEPDGDPNPDQFLEQGFLECERL